MSAVVVRGCEFSETSSDAAASVGERAEPDNQERVSTTDIATETTIHRTVPGSHTGYAPSPSPFEQAWGVSKRRL